MRQGIIHQTVTKGLNPNVLMKDSGVEWIGKIPEHWRLTKGRYLLKIESRGTIDQSEEISKEEGVIYYKVDDLNNVESNLILQESAFFVRDENIIPIPPPVILIPKRGAAISTNKVAISRSSCFIDPNIMAMRVLGAGDVHYVAYLLLARKLIDMVDVSSVPQINNKHIKPMLLPLPPKEEQKRITSFIESRLNQIQELTKKVKQQIVKLQEYHQSLISTAVTGRINVRQEDGAA